MIHRIEKRLYFILLMWAIVLSNKILVFTEALEGNDTSVTPTGIPTSTPSYYESNIPTVTPSNLFQQQTDFPTVSPTISPSILDINPPTISPSFVADNVTIPSVSPTVIVSSNPTIYYNQTTLFPSVPPTVAIPSILTTLQPSIQPSFAPTNVSEVQPSSAPSSQPTRFQTSLPSSSLSHTSTPVEYPTSTPTSVPSSSPNTLPSSMPSSSPSSVPTSIPSTMPSAVPNSLPSGLPTSLPTRIPSAQPNSFPSSSPTTYPSSIPSSSVPSSRPSTIPSVFPTSAPSSNPTSTPTSYPSSIPSTLPTSAPTFRGSAGKRWWYQVFATVSLEGLVFADSTLDEIEEALDYSINFILTDYIASLEETYHEGTGNTDVEEEHYRMIIDSRYSHSSKTIKEIPIALPEVVLVHHDHRMIPTSESAFSLGTTNITITELIYHVTCWTSTEDTYHAIYHKMLQLQGESMEVVEPMHEQGIHELTHVIIANIGRQLTFDTPPEDLNDLAPFRIYSIIFLTIFTFIVGIYIIRLISRSWTKESWLRSKARLCYYHSVDMVNLCWDRFYYYSHEFQESLYAIGTGEHRSHHPHHHSHSPLHTPHGLSSMGTQRRNPVTMFHLTTANDQEDDDYPDDMIELDGGGDDTMYNNHSEHDFPPQYLSVHYKKKVNYLEEDEDVESSARRMSSSNSSSGSSMTSPTTSLDKHVPHMLNITKNNLHHHNHQYSGSRSGSSGYSTVELQDEEDEGEDDEVDSKTGLVEMTSLPKTRITGGGTSPSPNKFTDGWF